jgi:outer membrane protein OmpA-like peptidoglycan-associated protein
LKKGAILFIIFSFLFACNKVTYLQLLSKQEQQLKSMPRYNNYLALEYLTFARQLLRVGDKKNSEYFAKKGRESALGVHLEPENPLIWKADSAQMKEMILMQKRLEDVLNASQIKTQLPIQASHLTYLYDCWIARHSTQIFLGNDLGQCRVRFAKLLLEIENYIDESKKDRTEKTKLIEPDFERFELLFDLGLYKLNKKAQKDLIEFLNYIKTLEGNYRILVVGNADRTGSELYNKGLALKRANIVINYLTKSGIHGDVIEVRAVGEDFPDIITRDDFSNANNRNVSLYVLKGLGSFDAYPLPLLENIVYKKEVEKARKDRGL